MFPALLSAATLMASSRFPCGAAWWRNPPFRPDAPDHLQITGFRLESKLKTLYNDNLYRSYGGMTKCVGWITKEE